MLDRGGIEDSLGMSVYSETKDPPQGLNFCFIAPQAKTGSVHSRHKLFPDESTESELCIRGSKACSCVFL